MNTLRANWALGGALSLWIAANPSLAQDLVVVYPSYSSDGTAVIEGRVTELDERAEAKAEDRRRDNFRRTMDLLSNDERADALVTLRIDQNEWVTLTDDEGYFHAEIIGFGAVPGWRTVTAKTKDGSGEAGLLVLPAENFDGVISDVDDTIQVTEVNSKRRMMANTLLRNPLQRQAVPGVVDFYRELAAANTLPDAAPIFYLSASPRQLHGSISAFLEHNKFPRGVLMTKRVTDDATSDPLTDQFAYKTAKIETIFSRVPGVRFTLVGDDGEKDPEIFASIRARFPDRVAAIWIRQVNPDPKRVRLPNQGILNERLAAMKGSQ